MIAFTTVIDQAVKYMSDHAGYRFTSSGEQRKEDIRDLLNQTAAFIPKASSVYQKSLATSLEKMDKTKKYGNRFAQSTMAALKAGIVVPGAQLVERTSTTIK